MANGISQNQILETLQLQHISKEEMEKRHILGRLYGPIATFGDSTRNGRLYNKELWTKALSDEVFLEKVANKSLFLELEHPADRDQIDMKQACACIPQVPKIVGDDLYAVIDILDTPNGRLLKTFVDYGFVPGISSRGSGEVDANDEVNPETFYLETWDIVSLPAVKKARLNVCESYNNKKTLKYALKEALENSTEEDQKIMRNTLDNMSITIDDNLTEVKSDPATEGKEVEVSEDVSLDSEIESVLTVKDLIDAFSKFDDASIVELETFTLDDKEYNVDLFIKDQDDENKKVILGVECTPIESTEDIKADNSDDEEGAEEDENETDGAVDDGAEEVVENFKELVRQKDLLESEVKSLKNAQSVSDTKVHELEESLNKYKFAFARTSELAAQTKKLKSLNEALNSKLSENTKEIAELRSQVQANNSLNENINKNDVKINRLTEKLQSMQTEFTETKTKLEEQVIQSNRKLQERTEIAKKYKTSYLNVIEHYIVSKAQMLGVKPVEITSRLNESYTIDDIDTVCDQILTESVGINRLPFGNDSKVKARINNSKSSDITDANNSANDFDLQSLIEFAGL